MQRRFALVAIRRLLPNSPTQSPAPPCRRNTAGLALPLSCPSGEACQNAPEPPRDVPVRRAPATIEDYPRHARSRAEALHTLPGAAPREVPLGRFEVRQDWTGSPAALARAMRCERSGRAAHAPCASVLVDRDPVGEGARAGAAMLEASGR